MNYIKKLEQDQIDLRLALEKTNERLQELYSYLNTPKFQWPEDWVRTWEVNERIVETCFDIREALKAD